MPNASDWSPYLQRYLLLRYSKATAMNCWHIISQMGSLEKNSQLVNEILLIIPLRMGEILECTTCCWRGIYLFEVCLLARPYLIRGTFTSGVVIDIEPSRKTKFLIWHRGLLRNSSLQWIIILELSSY